MMVHMEIFGVRARPSVALYHPDPTVTFYAESLLRAETLQRSPNVRTALIYLVLSIFFPSTSQWIWIHPTLKTRNRLAAGTEGTSEADFQRSNDVVAILVVCSTCAVKFMRYYVTMDCIFNLLFLLYVGTLAMTVFVSHVEKPYSVTNISPWYSQDF